MRTSLMKISLFHPLCLLFCALVFSCFVYWCLNFKISCKWQTKILYTWPSFLCLPACLSNREWVNFNGLQSSERRKRRNEQSKWLNKEQQAYLNRIAVWNTEISVAVTNVTWIHTYAAILSKRRKKKKELSTHRFRHGNDTQYTRI